MSPSLMPPMSEQPLRIWCKRDPTTLFSDKGKRGSYSSDEAVSPTQPRWSVSGPERRSSSISSISYALPVSKEVRTRRMSSIAPALQSSSSVSRGKTVTKICCVGAGYVAGQSITVLGGPTAAVIAFANPDIEVTVVDRDEKRIRRWKSQHLPIHEPGLSNIVRVARDGANAIDIARRGSLYQVRLPARAPNLFFSTDCDQHISEADIVFISVNTPTKTAGIGAGAATNISILESAVETIARAAKPGAIIVEKSTVPCRTAKVVQDILQIHRPGVHFDVLSNPEFLAEGTAIDDLLNPSRILIGALDTPSGRVAAARLASVYATWVDPTSILTVRLWSSELAKLVANAMLAQRISSMNTISAICEKTGADITDIAQAVGLDPRIGSQFLKAGLGFGGSCFKKDILSLSYLAESLDLPEVASYWRSVIEINVWQCARFVRRIIKNLNGSLTYKKVAILGYAFKKDTSDTRESQAIDVVRQLLQEERPAEIAIFDPRCNRQDVKDELTAFFSREGCPIIKPAGPVEVYANAYDTCADASAILILTEWDQFRYPSMGKTPSLSEPANLAVTSGPDLPIDCRESQINVFELPTLAQAEVSREENIRVRLNPQDDIWGRFRPEPQCPEYCRDCTGGYEERKQANEAVRWEEIVKSMRQPRWVFDGRGVVDQDGMENLGFKVESIGRADATSPLHGS